MISWVINFLTSGIYTAVGLVAICTSVFILVALAGKPIAEKYRWPLVAILWLIAGSFLGYAKGLTDPSQTIRELRADIRVMELGMEAQANVVKKANEKALERNTELEELNELVLNYEMELKNETSNRCPADSAYTKRLSDILSRIPTTSATRRSIDK